MKKIFLTFCFLSLFSIVFFTEAQVPVVPSEELLNSPFGKDDVKAFKLPSREFYPETWFHYIGGNVSLDGITADLEAIAEAGFSGIQLFHGHTGGIWSDVETPIACLSPLWDDAVKHTANECKRLGLRFTMQNCPGWAMAGGPWIQPENAMRHLVWSRTDIDAAVDISLPVPQPSAEDWRDYKDIAVLAFPTPEGDMGKPLEPETVESNWNCSWKDYLSEQAVPAQQIPPTTADKPYWIEVTYPETVIVRTLEFPPVQSLNHAMCYEPGVSISIQAYMPDGKVQKILDTELPQSSWQDDQPISFACVETAGAKKYRIEIVNENHMSLSFLHLFSASRKNSWESEAGWTLRSIERTGDSIEHSPETAVNVSQVLDISDKMDKDGNLKWNAPRGKWTILRIGHVNAGQRNAPAPPEGTGWECDKLSLIGSDVHFAGYIGRLSGNNGPLAGGLLNGMLLDSWECKTQTWTKTMEEDFERIAGYPLRRWLPAVFGYVMDDKETTFRFLRDWRAVIGNLFANNFFGNMAKHAKENGLSISFETAAGDIFPADILEYYKYADVPMCEFWHPFTRGYVGSLNFKPIKPTVSAARMYGKPRVGAEAFTSFNLTWDEHFQMLKEVSNINIMEGITHLIFHTYTHNPQNKFIPPGTSFGGAGIGTPFLRGQTWWPHLYDFNTYLARCGYLLERGKPVSDVLWYLGDEVNHKPDQEFAFPDGFKYDYCNTDALLNRISVRNGMLVTPEGIEYRVLWLPETPRMLPETLEKIFSLVKDGAVVIGDAPQGVATLSGGQETQKKFDDMVAKIWGSEKVGKGKVISGIPLDMALKSLNMVPDVRSNGALWQHRKIENADWYYICAPKEKDFSGVLDFRCTGDVELWDPVTGNISSVSYEQNDGRTRIALDLPRAGSCFVVFRNSGKQKKNYKKKEKEFVSALALDSSWKLVFPSGWGAPESLIVDELKAWKDLDLSAEAKAFSGTVKYESSFDIGKVKKGNRYILDLGDVDMVAVVSLNGKKLQTLWMPPYKVDITDVVRSGANVLSVEVTSTWFNRLVYDAGQPEADRKTWVLRWPDKNSPLRNSGLLGPVKVVVEK